MITSTGNRRIKDIRRLRECKGDLALLEGPLLLAEALAARTPLSEVLCTPAFLEGPQGAALVALLPEAPTQVDERVLARLGDADSPRGVLAVARLPRAGAASLPLEPGGCYLYADGVQDPGNLGALARVAEAAGAAGLAVAPGSAHPNHPRSLRASAGSLLRLPVATGVGAEEVSERLADIAPTWVALQPRGGTTLYEAALDGTIVLALGAEGPGLSPALLARATLRLTIPLLSPVESLNVAVAAAVVLFERRRRLLP